MLNYASTREEASWMGPLYFNSAVLKQLLMDMQGQLPMPKMRPMQLMQQMQAIHPPLASQAMHANNSIYADTNTGSDTYKSMFDADPFGLDTSMCFPTHFTCQESSMQW